jgi:hypothetical protein
VYTYDVVGYIMCLAKTFNHSQNKKTSCLELKGVARKSTKLEENPLSQ